MLDNDATVNDAVKLLYQRGLQLPGRRLHLHCRGTQQSLEHDVLAAQPAVANALEVAEDPVAVFERTVNSAPSLRGWSKAGS